MAKVIYYVAVSLDGFIAGPDEDISQFVASGNGVDKYLSDLNDFGSVIMGSKTYKFGYKFGLKPGQPAYPHMYHYIFSDSLHLPNKHELVHIEKPKLNRVKEIITSSQTDVYLCGGGQFAGWLLDNNLIDILKLKINPIILGSGTRLFGNSKSKANFDLMDSSLYENGLQINTYKVIK